MRSISPQLFKLISAFFKIYDCEAKLEQFMKRRERIYRDVYLTRDIQMDGPEAFAIRAALLTSVQKAKPCELSYPIMSLDQLSVQKPEMLKVFTNRTSWPAGYFQSKPTETELTPKYKKVLDAVLKNAIPNQYVYNEIGINKYSSTGAPFFMRDDPKVGEIIYLGLDLLTNKLAPLCKQFRDGKISEVRFHEEAMMAGFDLFYTTARRYQADPPDKERKVWTADGENVVSNKAWDQPRDKQFLDDIRQQAMVYGKTIPVNATRELMMMLRGDGITKARVRIPAAGSFLNKPGSGLFHPFLDHLKHHSCYFWNDLGPAYWAESLLLKGRRPDSVAIVASDISGMEQNTMTSVIRYVMKQLDLALPERLAIMEMAISRSTILSSAASDKDASQFGDLLVARDFTDPKAEFESHMYGTPSGSIVTSYFNGIAGAATWALEVELVTKGKILAEDIAANPENYREVVSTIINGDDRMSAYDKRWRQNCIEVLGKEPVIMGWPHSIENPPKFNGHLITFLKDEWKFMPSLDSYLTKVYNPEYTYGMSVLGPKSFPNLGAHARRLFYGNNSMAQQLFELEDHFWSSITGKSYLEHFPLSDVEKEILDEEAQPSQDVINILTILAKPELVLYNDEARDLWSRIGEDKGYVFLIPSDVVDKALTGKWHYGG